MIEHDPEKCREHSRVLKDLMVEVATQKQAGIDMKETQDKLSETFWKVEGKLSEKIDIQADKTTKLQIKTAVINATILILFGVANAIAIKVIINLVQ